MATFPRRYQIAQSGTPLTASGNSGELVNIGQSTNPTVVLVIDVITVSGTTPSLTFTLNSAIEEDADLIAIPPTVAIVAITAAGQARYVFHDVIEPHVQLNWAISGTTPSFAANVDLYFTSPDN